MAAEVIRSVLRIINTDRNSVFCVVNFRRIFILQVGGLSSRYNECFSLRDSRTAIFSRFDISNYDILSTLRALESMGLRRCVKQSYSGITRSLPSNQMLIKPALTKNTAVL